MSELPGESRVPEMSTMDDLSDVLRAGVAGRSRAREAQREALAEAAEPMLRILGPAPRPIPSAVPGRMSVPSMHRRLGLCEIHQERFHQYLHNSSMIPARLLRDIAERRREFVEGCRAREAAFDANPPEMDSDALAFILALTTSDAGSPLAD